MRTLLAVLVLVGTGWAQGVTLSSGSVTLKSGSVTLSAICGPPLYNCSRSDLNAAKLAANFQSIGGLTGAGTIVTDDMGNGNPILRLTDVNVDPSVSTLGISSSTLGAGGSGYAINDTGTISSGSTLATYTVNSVSSGAVATYTVTAAGKGYSVSNGVATATGGGHPGSGSGFTINITGVVTDSYVTASSGSGDMNIFSQSFIHGGDTHYLMCIQEAGTGSYFVDVDYTILMAGGGGAITRPYASGFGFNATGGITGKAATCSWGHTNYKAYFIKGQFLWSYDFTDWVSGLRTTPPVAVQEFDFTELTSGLPNFGAGNCLPSGYTSPTWVDDTSSSSDDQSFASAWSITGGQGTGILFAAYTVGKGCTVLNTSNGAVTGDWGFTGTLTLPVSGGFFVHSQKLSHGAPILFADVDCTSNGNGCGPAGPSPFLWKIGTNSFVASDTGAGNGGGHTVMGYLSLVNASNSSAGQQAIRLLATTPSSGLNLFGTRPAGIGFPFDAHQGWNNVDALDSVPFLETTYRPSHSTVCGLVSISGANLTLLFGHVFNTGWTGTIDVGGIAQTISTVPSTTSLTLTTSPGNTAQTTYCFAPITFGWTMEVMACTPSLTSASICHRFAHTMSSGEDDHFFDAADSIGDVSQDGKLYALTTDWLGTLGSTTGGASCTTTANCRSDVVVIALK